MEYNYDDFQQMDFHDFFEGLGKKILINDVDNMFGYKTNLSQNKEFIKYSLAYVHKNQYVDFNNVIDVDNKFILEILSLNKNMMYSIPENLLNLELLPQILHYYHH